MKKKLETKKTISYLLACSFLSISTLPAFAEEYMVLPPLVEEESIPVQQDRPLPNLNSGPNNDFMQQTQYNGYQQNNSYQNTNYNSNSNYPSTKAINTNLNTNYASTPLKGNISTVPVGTAFQIINSTNVNTKRNKVGDSFSAVLNNPISVDGNIIVPAGSEVVGQITYVENAGRIGRNAKMEVKFTRINPPNGQAIPMVGKVLTQDNTGVLKGGTLKEQLVCHLKREAVSTAGGAIIGTGLGAMAGAAGAGLAAGAATGGVAGVGWMIWRKGKEVTLTPGTKMIVVLEQPLNVND